MRRAGDEETARTIYRAVWEEGRARGDEYHTRAAAHMFGVSEPMLLAEKRRWHLDSLARARRGRGGWAASFCASVYVNLGYVALQQGRKEKAIRYYEWAQKAVVILADDEYGRNLRARIACAPAQLRESTRNT